MTKEIAVFETKLPVDFKNVYWRPWINVVPGQLDELTGLALHKHLRDRGGVPHGESLTVFVAIKDADCKAAFVTKFSVTKQ